MNHSSVGPRFIRAALLAGFLATTPAWALETTTNRVFQVSPGGRLVLDVDRGSIEVTTSDEAAVNLTVHREVKRASDSTAREMLDQHQLTFTQDGNSVVVKARMLKPDRSWRGPNLSVRYQVVVPKQFDLQFDTAGGSIRVPDLTGKVDLGTAGGSISVGKLDGTLKAETAGGSVTVEGATGPTSVETAGGSIRLGVMGAAVNAETAGGSIQIKSAAGPVKAETSGGSIELGDLQGPVEADTSGGSISARFSKNPADVSLATSGGSISVYVPEDSSFNLDAECSGGRVSSEVPVTISGKPSRSELRGPVGQGGAKVVLRTSGGGIAIKKLVATK